MNLIEVTPERLLSRELNQIETKNSPKLLYVSGSMKIPLPQPRCAIVGTREPSDEGQKYARHLAEFLVKNSVTVISGLAKGIDTEAHKGAIESGGQTIAVLGTPLDKFYPIQNKELQKEIMQKHLAVSQYKLGQVVHPGNFILRNRTMALLCDASIVIEAEETSGTLSHAWEVLRLGRPLFILGSVFERNDLKWPEKMIKYGAIKLNEFSEILEWLPSSDSNYELPEL